MWFSGVSKTFKYFVLIKPGSKHWRLEWIILCVLRRSLVVIRGRRASVGPWAAPPGCWMQGGGGGIVPLGISGWWTLFSVQVRRRSPTPPTETAEPPRNHWPGRSPAWWTANKQTNMAVSAFQSSVCNRSSLNCGENSWFRCFRWRTGSGLTWTISLLHTLVSSFRLWTFETIVPRPLCCPAETHTDRQVNTGVEDGVRPCCLLTLCF